MSFQVEPVDLRAYAGKLQNLYGDVADAKTYVQAHGNFAFHQSGIIGVLSGQHAAWMGHLEEMLDHLLVLTEAAPRALRTVADTYEGTDDQAAARVDAGYPAAPRPTLYRD
ncbi:hypothetical protein ACWKSP_31130 [Micromonosporaceae bacterium Da 78-11]